MITSYRVQRKVKMNGWVFGPSRPQCECITMGVCSEENCSPRVASGCKCHYEGYCGRQPGESSCSTQPHEYAGEYYVNDSDSSLVKSLLTTGILVYDPTIPSAEELMEQDRYKALFNSHPKPGEILFPVR